MVLILAGGGGVETRGGKGTRRPSHLVSEGHSGLLSLRQHHKYVQVLVFVLCYTDSFVQLLEEWTCILRTYPSLQT